MKYIPLDNHSIFVEVEYDDPIFGSQTAEFELPQGREWSLAKRLHPTPAVSGWPVQDALDLIRENELLMQYSELRIESLEAVKKSVMFDNEIYRKEVEAVYRKIDSVIGLLNTP